MELNKTRRDKDHGIVALCKKITEQARLCLQLEDQQIRAKELYYIIGRACYHHGREHLPSDCHLAADELDTLMDDMLRSQERLDELGEKAAHLFYVPSFI